MARTTAAPLTVVGSSTESYTQATEDAVRKASRTIRGIRAADVVSLSAVVDEQRIVEYRATVRLSLT